MISAAIAAGFGAGWRSSRVKICRACDAVIAGDVANQPEDMSFVIDSVLAESKKADSPLAGLIDRKRIGAAGHSNGAITIHGCRSSIKTKKPGSAIN